MRIKATKYCCENTTILGKIVLDLIYDICIIDSVVNDDYFFIGVMCMKYQQYCKLSHEEICQRIQYAAKDLTLAETKQQWYDAFSDLQDLKNALCVHYPYMTTSDLYKKLL